MGMGDHDGGSGRSGCSSLVKHSRLSKIAKYIPNVILSIAKGGGCMVGVELGGSQLKLLFDWVRGKAMGKQNGSKRIDSELWEVLGTGLVMTVALLLSKLDNKETKEVIKGSCCRVSSVDFFDHFLSVRCDDLVTSVTSRSHALHFPIT